MLAHGEDYQVSLEERRGEERGKERRGDRRRKEERLRGKVREERRIKRSKEKRSWEHYSMCHLLEPKLEPKSRPNLSRSLTRSLSHLMSTKALVCGSTSTVIPTYLIYIMMCYLDEVPPV